MSQVVRERFSTKDRGGFRMGRDWYRDVVDFHKEVVGGDFPLHPHIPEPRRSCFQRELIREEVIETLQALESGDLVELVDGICDSIFALLGTAVICGIDIRPFWDEVHRTNMLKGTGKLRGDGKIMSSPDWKPPRIRELLEEQV